MIISEATVKTHASHVFAKIGARDRVQAVIAAYQSGLVTADEQADANTVKPRRSRRIVLLLAYLAPAPACPAAPQLDRRT